jgi:hypothetical protein
LVRRIGAACGYDERGVGKRKRVGKRKGMGGVCRRKRIE